MNVDTNSQDSRLQKYKLYRSLLKGDHFQAFSNKIASTKFNEEYRLLTWLSYNITARVSEVYADMLFGEDITIKTSQPELTKWYEQLVENSNLNSELSEMAVTTSALGDGVLRILTGSEHSDGEAETKTAYRELLIQSVDPKTFFPEVNKGNYKKDPTKAILRWQEVKQVNDKKKTYTIDEIHEPGKITYSIREGKTELTKEQRTQQFPDYQDVNVPISSLTIEHIPNKRVLSYWGVSDYYDIENLVFSYAQHTTGVSEVINKMIDPIKSLPASVYTRIQQDKMEKARSAGDQNARPEPVTANDLAKYKVLFNDGESADPKVITWDAQLTSAFNLLDRLEQNILKVKSIPKFLIDGTAEGINSGIALERRLIALRKAIKRKRYYYQKAIANILYTAQQLSVSGSYRVNGKQAPSKLERPTIIFSDPLPKDIAEIVDVEVAELNNGLTTTEQAIANVQGVSIEDAADIKEKVRLENESKLRATVK